MATNLSAFQKLANDAKAMEQLGSGGAFAALGANRAQFAQLAADRASFHNLQVAAGLMAKNSSAFASFAKNGPALANAAVAAASIQLGRRFGCAAVVRAS